MPQRAVNTWGAVEDLGDRTPNTMNDSKTDAPHVDSIHSDRRTDYFIAVPEWITVAKLSPQALAVYVILLGHVNRERGDNLAWPTLDTIAELTGYSRRQSVTPYVNELVALEVVQVRSRRTERGRRNYYTVTKQPPAWWVAAPSIAEFHKARRTPDEMGMCAPPHEGMCAVPHDPMCAPPHQIETNATTRRDTDEKTSGDTSGAAPRTSSPRIAKIANPDGRITLTPPAAFYRKGAWKDGRAQQWMVGAAVAALENAGKPIATGVRDKIGAQIKTVFGECGREDLVRSLEERLTMAVQGDPEMAWLFDSNDKRPPRLKWRDIIGDLGNDPEEALIEHLHETEPDFGIDATVYSMSERYHPNAIANTVRARAQ